MLPVTPPRQDRIEAGVITLNPDAVVLSVQNVNGQSVTALAPNPDSALVTLSAANGLTGIPDRS